MNTRNFVAILMLSFSVTVVPALRAEGHGVLGSAFAGTSVNGIIAGTPAPAASPASPASKAPSGDPGEFAGAPMMRFFRQVFQLASDKDACGHLPIGNANLVSH